MTKKQREGYEVVPIPVMRRFSLDAGYMGRRRHIVHGLLEVDVTDARRVIREHKAQTGEALSFTAFIITCLAKAAGEHKAVHAYRNWRNQLVIFDDVDVNTMIEIETERGKVPIPHIIRAADKRSLRDIHDEIRATQAAPRRSGESQFMSWFLYLPAFIRRLFYRVVMRVPRLFREYSSPVLVTAVGMFGKGGGWGIPVANFTLSVTLGGIVEKPGVIDGQIEVREYLDMTVSFDHDIIDGGPATRFARRFVALIESGYGLIEQVPESGADQG
jgi:hypothetical protein